MEALTTNNDSGEVFWRVNVSGENEVLTINETSTERGVKHLAYLIVLHASQILSLLGLALTFVTYAFIPELRTLPGKITMALVFHLFFAQLLLLTAGFSSDHVELCQVLGVLHHYFWLSSFAWMSVAAFHAHSVFTRFHMPVHSGPEVAKLFIRYTAICVAIPVLGIAINLASHLIPSRGTHSGYGGGLCFFNNVMSFGLFFFVPLVIMIIFNSVFFIRTICAIRYMSDIQKSSSVANRNHVFVYLKLSLLFGFTWIFFILESMFAVGVLSYIFLLLTGSQGVLIFAAYCLNGNTRTLLKNKCRVGWQSQASTTDGSG